MIVIIRYIIIQEEYINWLNVYRNYTINCKIKEKNKIILIIVNK